MEDHKQGSLNRNERRAIKRIERGEKRLDRFRRFRGGIRTLFGSTGGRLPLCVLIMMLILGGTAGFVLALGSYSSPNMLPTGLLVSDISQGVLYAGSMWLVGRLLLLGFGWLVKYFEPMDSRAVTTWTSSIPGWVWATAFMLGLALVGAVIGYVSASVYFVTTLHLSESSLGPQDKVLPIAGIGGGIGLMIGLVLVLSRRKAWIRVRQGRPGRN